MYVVIVINKTKILELGMEMQQTNKQNWRTLEWKIQNKQLKNHQKNTKKKQQTFARPSILI
jgi:hypothetical protein